jgi:hypothetical protein
MKPFIALLFLGIIAKAQPLGEGWHHVAPEQISLDEKLASLSSQAKLQETGALQAAEVATNSISANLVNPDFSELEELAKGLKYDPLLIFEHVVNHYEIKFYDGILKGALQTFYDRAGNDWDLCLLTAKLLEIAQTQNPAITDVKIAYGYMAMTNAEVASWIGCENDRAIISEYLAASTIAFNDSNASQYTLERAWIKVTYQGTIHPLDVGYKPHAKADGIDLKAAMNLNGATFYQQAGGSVGVDWVSGLNRTAINQYLNARCGDLKSYLKTQHENDGIMEVLGGKKIIEFRFPRLPVALDFYAQEVASYSLRDLPSSEISRIQFQHRAINVTYPMHEIAGRKIALVYEASSRVSALAEEAVAMSAEEKTAAGLLIPPPHEPVIQNAGELAGEPEESKSEQGGLQAEAIVAANQLVDFGACLQGTADVLDGLVYGNPSLGNWIRLESRMISGSNAFRPEHVTAKRIEYGQSIQLAAYLKNSTIARGSYTGQIEYKLFWSNNTLPFQTIIHDLTGRVSERASLTYTGGAAMAQIGQTKDFTVSFRNTGTQPMSISSIALSGTGASQFAFVNGNGAGSLAAGATRVITLRYTARAEATHTATVNVTLAYDGISGYSLPIGVEGTGYYLPRARLYIDDVLVAEEPVGTLGESVEDFTWSIDHNGVSRDQAASYSVKRGATYAVCSDFGHSKLGHRLKSAQRKLNRSRATQPEGSQAVMTDTLQLMGQTWMQQTSQGNLILESLTKSEVFAHHRFGLVAQEEGYSVTIQVTEIEGFSRNAEHSDSMTFCFCFRIVEM